MMTSPICQKSRRRAFTLLEMLLTVAVLAILVAVVVPRAGRSFGRLALRDAAETLATNVRFAQATAIARGSTMGVAFDTDAGTYRLEEWTGKGVQPVPGPMGEPFRLPAGVVFADIQLRAEDGTTKVDSLTFYPDGRGSSGEIKIVGAEGAFGVSVTRAVGRVLLSDLTEGANAGPKR